MPALHQLHDNRGQAIRLWPPLGDRAGADGHLLAWRMRMLAQFQYDPRAPVPEPEVRALAHQYLQQEEGLRARLQRGAAELGVLAGLTEEQLRPNEERIRRPLSRAG